MIRSRRTGVLLACLTLLALVGCASASSRAQAEGAVPDLQVTLAAPVRVVAGEPLPVTFTLTNNTDAPLYVLTWYTPLEGIAGEIFHVTCGGEEVPYEGILASRVAPSPEAYVLLEPGTSTTAEVNLASAYDVSRPGDYSISFVSPWISDVAGGESEMAASLDDLGPVDMPSNTITVEVVEPDGGTQDS